VNLLVTADAQGQAGRVDGRSGEGKIDAAAVDVTIFDLPGQARVVGQMPAMPPPAVEPALMADPSAFDVLQEEGKLRTRLFAARSIIRFVVI